MKSYETVAREREILRERENAICDILFRHFGGLWGSEASFR